MFKPKRRKRKSEMFKKTFNSAKSVNSLKMFSCNSSGVKNKLLSLGKVINDLEVGVFCIQETHASKKGSIKFKNSTMYQIMKIYSILAGWRPPKLDDLKVAGILALTNN